MQIKPVHCACGGVFDVDFAVTASVKNTSDLIKLSQDRLCAVASSHCFNCLAQQRAGMNSGFDNTQKFEIKHQPSIANSPHFLCQNCQPVIRLALIESFKKSKEPNKEEFSINCKVCDAKHRVEIRKFKHILKGDGKCCNIL
jgi:hypothetical protein